MSGERIEFVPALMTKPIAAIYLSCSVREIEELRARNEITAFGDGKWVKFKKSELDRYIATLKEQDGKPMSVGDTVTVGDHVDVTEFVRRGDEKDTNVINGWVAEISDHRILLAASADFDTEPDPWMTSFPLTGRDAVVVTLDRTKSRTPA